MKIMEYLSFALEIGSAVQSITMLVQSKQKLTGVQVQAAVNPAVGGLQTLFNLSLPAPLVTDVCQAAADAVNKYVLGIS